MNIVEDLMNKAFTCKCRDPRSAEYKAGCRALLERKINGTPMPRPYAMGTVQADAFYAGTDEGHDIYRAYQQRSAAGREASHG